MKKYDTLLKIIIIALCIGSAFFIQSVGDDILVMHSNNTCRQIYLRADEILKKEADERERIGMQSDIAINRLLDQINANMSEEYWLFETQRKTKGPLSLDIYVDDIENIEHIVVVPLDKVAFVNEKGDEYYFIYITEYNEYACGTPRMETPGVFLYFLRCQNIWIFVEKSICKKRM